MQIDSQEPRESTALAFLGRSAFLNVLFAVEAGVSFLLDVILAAALGLSAHSDALYGAWGLPQRVGRGMFQSLTNSFMGLFGERTDRRAAYSQAITVIGAAALPLAGLLSITSAWWLPITIPGAAAETQSAAIPLARIMAWLVGLLALAETFRAIYYQEGQLWLPSLSRVAGIVASIAMIVAARAGQNLTLAAWAMTVGAGIEALLGLVCMPFLLGFRYRPAWPSRDRLREMTAVVGAPLAGQGAHVLSGIGEQMLASLLPTGSITAANYAKRILNTLERFVFRGFMITTIRSHSEQAKPDLRSQFRLVMLVAIPVAALLAALPVPLISIVFGRGRFGAEDTRTLALAVQMFAPAVILMGIGRIPYGLAYARKRVGPLFVSAVLSAAALVVSEALFICAGLGMRSFGLGSTVAGAVSLTWLYLKVIRREPAQMLDRSDALRLAAVAVSALAGTALMAGLAGMLPPSVAPRSLVTLAAGLFGCGLFFIVAAWALHFPEVRRAPAVLKRFWQKRFRR